MSEPKNWPDGQPVTPWADPWHDVAGDLRALGSFTRPLSPEERAERERASQGSGQLTRELIARLLAGEFNG
jgi:hypothetical protein